MGLVSQAVHDGGRHVIGYHSLSLFLTHFFMVKFSLSLFSPKDFGWKGTIKKSEPIVFVLVTFSIDSICHVIVSCRVIPKTLMPREVCLLQPAKNACSFFFSIIKFSNLFIFISLVSLYRTSSLSTFGYRLRVFFFSFASDVFLSSASFPSAGFLSLAKNFFCWFCFWFLVSIPWIINY